MSVLNSNTSNNFGLTPKKNVVKSEDEKVLNFKIKVGDDFYRRWVATMTALSKSYDGGGCAIVLSLIEEKMAELEFLAAELNLPALATEKRGV